MSHEAEPFVENLWEPRSFWLRRPRPIGERFLVVRGDRAFHTPPSASGRIPILLELRHAFGSGGHASTEGCLVALEKAVEGGERVLDLGTGSGILAIAARKLGASHVTAVDIRESACREARGNLLLNGIREGMEVHHGGIESANGRFDIVLANLRAPILRDLMEKIIEKMVHNGVQIISGIMTSEYISFRSFLERYPLTPLKTAAVGGWMTLVSRRNGAEVSRPSGSGSPG